MSNQNYGPPQYQTQYKQPGSGRATASVVCGIVGFFIAGIILGPIAILLGYSAKKQGYQGTKAKAGIILGIVAFACGALVLLLGNPF
ncbi:MAG: DUF4190 domain-containing protein [Prevotella sp.]|jgi:Na+/melibiose symporter-like transporter|nr:DUF4190 domain-containing protein [Prevotella sp.]